MIRKCQTPISQTNLRHQNIDKQKGTHKSKNATRMGLYKKEENMSPTLIIKSTKFKLQKKKKKKKK